MKSDIIKKPYGFLGMLNQRYIPQGLRIIISKIYIPVRYYLYHKWVLGKYLNEEEKKHKGKKRILFWAFEVARDSITFGLLHEKLKERYWMVSCRWRDNYGYQKLFKPDLIIAQELRNESSRYYMRMARRKLPNTKIITLNGECTVHNKAIRAFISSWEEDGEIVAGPKMKEILVANGRNPDKIHVFGNPRYDIYAQQTYMSQKEVCCYLKLDTNYPIVLYVTNYVFKVEGRKKYMPDYPYEIVKEQKLKSINALLNIALRNRGIQFVIKLHPNEEDDIYSDFIENKGVSNCIIIGRNLQDDEISIYDLIPNVDVVLGFTSTALMEGWFCNKPTISCLFVRGLDEIQPPFLKGCDIVESEVGLEEKIRCYLNNPKLEDQKKLKFRKEYIDDWFSSNDGKSTTRVCNFIDSVL